VVKMCNYKFLCVFIVVRQIHKQTNNNCQRIGSNSDGALLVQFKCLPMSNLTTDQWFGVLTREVRHYSPFNTGMPIPAYFNHS